MNTIQGSGAGLSAELMRAMDDLSREMRKDHRDQAMHEASEALAQGLEEAEDLRDQASSAMTGAIVGGSLTALGGAAQCYSAARMETGLPEAARPAQEAPKAEMAPPAGTAAGPSGAAATGSAPGSTNPADPATQQQNALKERELNLKERELNQTDALQQRDARNKPWNVTAKSGETTATLGANMQKLFETKGDFHAADAREHAAWAQAANRRADAEQSGAQEAQKTSEKARDLHQQIVALDHASRMAVLRG